MKITFTPLHYTTEPKITYIVGGKVPSEVLQRPFGAPRPLFKFSVKIRFLKPGKIKKYKIAMPDSQINNESKH